jgi:hypothetical protein
MAEPPDERRVRRPSGGVGSPAGGPEDGAVDRGGRHAARTPVLDADRARERRRILQRHARRRRRRRNLLLGLAALLAAIALFFVIRALVSAGKNGGEPGREATTTAPIVTTTTRPSSTGATTARTTSTSTPGSTGDVVLLRLTDGAETKAVLALTAAGEPAMILGIPDNTLLRGSAGFKTVHELLTEGKLQVVEGALATLLGTSVTGMATLPWAALRDAVPASNSGTTVRPADASTTTTLVPDPDAAALAAAQAAAALAGSLGTPEGRTALAALALDGDKDKVRAALTYVAGAAKVVDALPGRLVEGADFVYYEPDTAKTRALLGGEAAEKAVNVEVQNGSGVVGIAQAVGEVIAAKGYTLLPPKNADKFPDVATTQVYAAPDLLAEADRIRILLGKGKVVRQDGLPAGKIVVVVGKDLPLESVPKVGP